MNEKKYICLFIFLFVISFIFGATTTYLFSRRQSESLRKQLAEVRTELDTTREFNKELGVELDNARNINNELRRTIESSKDITRELGTSVTENITTIRQCIELVRIIRTQVENLQNHLDSIDTDSGYSDNYNLL